MARGLYLDPGIPDGEPLLPVPGPRQRPPEVFGPPAAVPRPVPSVKPSAPPKPTPTAPEPQRQRGQRKAAGSVELQQAIDDMPSVHDLLAGMEQHPTWQQWSPEQKQELVDLYHGIVTRNSTPYKSADPQRRSMMEARIQRKEPEQAALEMGLPAKPDYALTEPERMEALAKRAVNAGPVGQVQQAFTGKPTFDARNNVSPEDAGEWMATLAGAGASYAPAAVMAAGAGLAGAPAVVAGLAAGAPGAAATAYNQYQSGELTMPEAIRQGVVDTGVSGLTQLAAPVKSVVGRNAVQTAIGAAGDVAQGREVTPESLAADLAFSVATDAGPLAKNIQGMMGRPDAPTPKVDTQPAVSQASAPQSTPAQPAAPFTGSATQRDFYVLSLIRKGDASPEALSIISADGNDRGNAGTIPAGRARVFLERSGLDFKDVSMVMRKDYADRDVPVAELPRLMSQLPERAAQIKAERAAAFEASRQQEAEQTPAAADQPAFTGKANKAYWDEQQRLVQQADDDIPDWSDVPAVSPLNDARQKLGAAAAADNKADAQAGRVGTTAKGVNLPDAKGRYQSANLELGDFLRRNKEVAGTVTQRLADKIREGFREKFISFPKLKEAAKKPFFADAVEALRQGRPLHRIASGQAADDLARVLTPLKDAKQLDFMGDYLMVRNWVDDLENGRVESVPGGFKLQDLQAEKLAMEQVMKVNPDIAEAVARHDVLMEGVRGELVNLQKLDPETARPFYFPHKVQDFINRRGGGYLKGRKLNEPQRKYLKERKGTKRDVLTDYVEVMYDHLRGVYRDNQADDLLFKTAEAYDIRKRKPADVDLSPAPGKRAMWRNEEWTIKGVGPKGLTLEKPGSGPVNAKNVTVIPDGYVLFQPASGKNMIPVETATGRTVTTIGTPKRAVVIPEELNDVLLNYKADVIKPQAISSVVAKANTMFKRLVLGQSVLTAPKRFIPYNRRNLVSDTANMFTLFGAEPFGKIPQAAKDLLAHARGESVPRIQEAIKRGVIGSGNVAQEIGTAKQLEPFARFRESDMQSLIGEPRRFIKFIENKLSGVSETRENLYRLAVFYTNLDRMQAGKPMAEGISDLQGLSDPVNAAAKVAREGLIDYGDQTQFTEEMRRSLIPFVAWLKGNTEWHLKLLQKYGPKAVVGKGAVGAARGAAWVLPRLAVLHGAAMAWNEFMHPEQEELLDEETKGRWHINTGMYDEEGNPIVFSDPLALDDFAETIGLGGITPDLRALLRGERTLAEVAKERGWRLAEGPGRMAMEAVGPAAKAPAALVGVKTYPRLGYVYDQGQRPLNAAGELGLSAIPGVGEVLSGKTDKTPQKMLGLTSENLTGLKPNRRGPQTDKDEIRTENTREDYFIEPIRRIAERAVELFSPQP
jgi:hypothetical protein